MAGFTSGQAEASPSLATPAPPPSLATPVAPPSLATPAAPPPPSAALVPTSPVPPPPLWGFAGLATFVAAAGGSSVGSKLGPPELVVDEAPLLDADRVTYCNWVRFASSVSSSSLNK